MSADTAIALQNQRAILAQKADKRMNTRYECRLCSKVHPFRQRRKFNAIPIEGRMRAILIHKYCDYCLAHDHNGRGCTSSERCRVCKEKHHTLLHLHGDVQARLGRHKLRRSHQATKTDKRRAADTKFTAPTYLGGYRGVVC